MGFRKDFIWGSATAAYQIEGAWQVDGRGESVWDRYCHQPGNVYQGHTGDVLCDHYHRYPDDIRLMKELGIPSYRFSVSWPRIFPEGKGNVNEKGLDFYDRLIDTTLDAGIRPFMTLFHWDYPSALQACGAWENPDSPHWFEDYAALLAKRYGDRVKDFITLNEPQCFIGFGYVDGSNAPGLKLPISSTVPMSHNVLKAHGLAARALHSLVPGCNVGYAPCGNPAIPATESPADIEAARKAYFDQKPTSKFWAWDIAWWSDPALLGRYPEKGLQLWGKYLPNGWEKDLDMIHQPLEFYAQNIYLGDVYRAADNADGYEQMSDPMGAPRTAAGWTITPDALYWAAKFLTERYHTPFIVSENGMSCHDAVSLDGRVHDPNRQDYLHRYLRGLKRAADEGIDVAGYFVWSFLDNFEWALGCSERFGLVHVDYQTQKRTPKDSAYWYKQVIQQNGDNL